MPSRLAGLILGALALGLLVAGASYFWRFHHAD
jgi:hypothetical protein